MNKQEMTNFISNIENKLGKENSGLIADDLGLLITDNDSMNQMIETTKNELNAEKSRTQKLTEANSSLLRQVGNYLTEETPTTDTTEEKLETFKDVSFSEFFDSKGRFIR